MSERERSSIEVVINGVKYVPETPTEQSAPCFAVGDFVKLVETCGGGWLDLPHPGDCGKVVIVTPEGAVGVEFPKPFGEGHDLDGYTAKGHGRWFYPESPSSRQLIESTSQLEKV